MDGELLTLEVYMPSRGTPLAESADGEVTLRLSVPGCDAAAARELLAHLRAQRDGDGGPVRLVAVRDG